MSSMEELKKSVQDWRDIVVFNAHNDSLRAFSDALISASPDLNRISGWTLAASGALAGLLISNTENVIGQYYQIDNIKTMLSILVLSILCGLAQKYLATLCEIHSSVSNAISIKLKEAIAQYEEHKKSLEEFMTKHSLDIKVDFDIKHTASRYAELSPFYIRWRVKQVMAKSMEDPEYSCRRILKIFYRQNIWLFLQAIFFICFIIVAILFL